jgi:hypothetical protein
MKLSGQQYQFNQLKDEIHMALARNTFPSTIFNTVNNIVRVINAIRQTRGIHWARTVQDNGQPVFTPIEQQRYTELLQPYVPAILEFFNEEQSRVQKGGAPVPSIIGVPAARALPATALPATALPATALPATALPASISTTNVARSSLAANLAPVAPLAEAKAPEAETPVAGTPEAETPVAKAQVAPVAPVAPVAAPVTAPVAAPGAPIPVSLMAAGPGGTGPMPVSLMAMPVSPMVEPVVAPITETPSKMGQLGDSLSSGLSDKMKSIDLSSLTPDVLFDKVMSTYQGINRSMNETMEAVHFEKETDEKPDIPLGQTGIMIPPRFIIFLIYYILDITRVAVSVHGNETGRKLLSIVVAILDVVRGDWKKAILTFVGYYGSSPLLIGQALKTYLTVIQMLSPTIQIKLPYFMYDSVKSMVFGVLLSIIQIGAPKPVRDQLEKMLTTLSDVQKDIDAKLNALNPPLSSRPDYFKVNFSNLNDLQAILDDPVYICSKEHRDAVENLLANAKEGAPIIQFILSLMRYPHTKGMTQYLCDSKAKTSYVDLLVAEGLDRERTEEGIANADAKSDAKSDAKTDAKTDSESATETTKGGSRSKKRVIRMKASYSK